MFADTEILEWSEPIRRPLGTPDMPTRRSRHHVRVTLGPILPLFVFCFGDPGDGTVEKSWLWFWRFSSDHKNYKIFKNPDFWKRRVFATTHELKCLTEEKWRQKVLICVFDQKLTAPSFVTTSWSLKSKKIAKQWNPRDRDAADA